MLPHLIRCAAHAIARSNLRPLYLRAVRTVSSIGVTNFGVRAAAWQSRLAAEFAGVYSQPDDRGLARHGIHHGGNSLRRHSANRLSDWRSGPPALGVVPH